MSNCPTLISVCNLIQDQLVMWFVYSIDNTIDALKSLNPQNYYIYIDR